MKITGNDELSLKILHALEKGMKIKDVISLFPVSIDQAKRLSRYHNIFQRANKNLPAPIIEKIRMLGLKTLYLSSLFKMEDWEGIVDILSSVNKNTTRKELPLLIEALNEKRKRVSDFQQEVDVRLRALETKQEELKQLEYELKVTQEKIEQETLFLNKYPQEAKLFLIKHLGIYENKLVLARRLDSNWQRSLKKRKILQYDDEKYIWHVNDLDEMVNDYLKRIRRKTPFPTEWDYEKEEKRNQNSRFTMPSNQLYRLPNGLAENLWSNIDLIHQKISSIASEKTAIQDEIKKLKKSSPKSFIESVEAMNTLSVRELKLHGELQNKALKWLYNNDYVASSEVVLPNGKRADVIGFNEAGHIVIIEVKVSSADFRQDEKWMTYLHYCDEFYFLTKDGVHWLYYAIDKCKGIGLLQERKNGLQIREPYTLEQEAVTDREKVQFAISKSLSKKFVYGY